MYIIVNPKTLAMRDQVFRTLAQAQAQLEKGIETYGYTTEWHVYKLVQVKDC